MFYTELKNAGLSSCDFDTLVLLRALIKNYGDFLMKKEIKRKGMTAPSCGGGENLL